MIDMTKVTALAGHKRGLKCGNSVSADPKSGQFDPEVAKATPAWGRNTLK